MIRIGVLAIVACGAGPALAQKIVVPQGCEAFLTVQSKNCSVSHYWRCEGAGPEGATWEATYDGKGPVSVSLYDREFQWLDSQRLRTGTREYLVEPANDPASFSALLAEGSDAYDFVIREDGADGTSRDVRHVGIDELTGRTRVIDGVELMETQFSAIAADGETGEEIYTVRGNQYILPDERIFFLGQDVFSSQGDEVEGDGSPMTFHRPGEAGFGQAAPIYECAGPTDIRFVPEH